MQGCKTIKNKLSRIIKKVCFCLPFIEIKKEIILHKEQIRELKYYYNEKIKKMQEEFELFVSEELPKIV
jgi:hypothetical protein